MPLSYPLAPGPKPFFVSPTNKTQIWHFIPSNPASNLSPTPATKEQKWSLNLVKMLNHTDASREDGANHIAPVTCILPMPHNVYTGDEGGRVVRSSLFSDLYKGKEGEWYSRKAGFEGRVEKRAGAGTNAGWGGVVDRGTGIGRGWERMAGS